jgi:hypothetical protein
MNTIERAEILEAYSPIFDVPTTGTLSAIFSTSPPIRNSTNRVCALLTGTKRMVGLPTASAIASASM